MGTLNYSTESPDELTLINFARFCGYKYINTSHDNDIEVEINGEIKLIKMLNRLEFTN